MATKKSVYSENHLVSEKNGRLIDRGNIYYIFILDCVSVYH